uniref:Uncharacterized protein n=1 Tax=Anguilla anguilla TaxID=7936 RepID=A0A0E9WS87_ANGAN
MRIRCQYDLIECNQFPLGKLYLLYGPRTTFSLVNSPIGKK